MSLRMNFTSGIFSMKVAKGFCVKRDRPKISSVIRA